VDEPIFIPAGDVDAPWIAAHLAVLNEAAMDVGLDVDFHLLAAERTADQELVWHSGILPQSSTVNSLARYPSLQDHARSLIDEQSYNL
jgi:hypothetical protein